MQSQVYPWRRYWARLFDITFIMPIYIFIIALFSPGLNYTITRMDNFIGGILLLLFYLIFFEPMMLSSFGTTPGKVLLGIKIRDLSGKKISYTTGMKRGSLLWLNGIICLQQIKEKRNNQLGREMWNQRNTRTIKHF